MDKKILQLTTNACSETWCKYRVFWNDCKKVWVYCSGQEATYKQGQVSFYSLDWSILIYSFQKILSPFSNFPLFKTFEVWNCENMENTLKIKVFIKSISFCKYLRNESSDLYEILCGIQILSCELKFQILWKSVHKCAHTSCKRARACFIASARIYDLCACICARISAMKVWILMKFHVVVNYYLVS